MNWVTTYATSNATVVYNGASTYAVLRNGWKQQPEDADVPKVGTLRLALRRAMEIDMDVAASEFWAYPDREWQLQFEVDWFRAQGLDEDAGRAQVALEWEKIRADKRRAMHERISIGNATNED